MSGWVDDVAAEASILFDEYRARVEATGTSCDGVTVDDFVADAIDRVGQDPDSVSVANATGSDSANDSSQRGYSWDESPDNPANYPSWLGGTRPDLGDEVGLAAQDWLERMAGADGQLYFDEDRDGVGDELGAPQEGRTDADAGRWHEPPDMAVVPATAATDDSRGAEL